MKPDAGRLVNKCVRGNSARLLAIAFIACSLTSLPSCGTYLDAFSSSPHDGPRAYGGVRWDFETIDFSNAGFLVTIYKAIYLLVDVPLSAVADTILLPYTFPRELFHETPDDESQSP